MQVTETLNQGLKREFRVVLTAADLKSKLATKLDEMRARANIPGFRPGKVPVAHLERLYGKSVMAEIINDAVTESTRSVATDHALKLANEPKIVMTEDKDEIEAVINGKADLSYSMEMEVLPKIELQDFKGIALTKDVADLPDQVVDDALARIADNNRPFLPKGEGAVAASGDKVTIDYRGTIDGVPFEGGSAEGADLVLGSGMFIPGFEDQIVGKKVGEGFDVNVSFPEGYAAEHLAGKAAVFAVTLKDVAAAGTVTIDDAFATTLGLADLAALKNVVREQLGREDAGRSRQRVKRRLLDKLDAAYKFDLPQTLVDQEFEIIWRNVSADMERAKRTFEDENTTEEAAKTEYRGIAERRVRLGLLLAEIGEKNEIKVSDEEMQRGMIERIRQFPPEQQRKAWEFFSKNQQAMAEVRAPIFEEKVVDFILELASVTENKVSREELYKDEDEAPAAA